MDTNYCPPWIDPGNAFRLVVNCEKYKASLDYGIIEMDEQKHEIWLDISSGYNLDKFVEDMATKTIWGRSQTLAIWAVDTDSAAGWKLRRNEHFEKMIQSRLNQRMPELNVEIVEKDAYQYQNLQSSVATSGITSHAGPSKVCPPSNVEGVGDTSTSPQMEPEPVVEVDWDSLIIFPQPDQDGEAHVLVDEDNVFEAMGFKAADQTAAEEEI
ncbi:unnamed protein product [Urochloa humidicola]